MSKSSGLSFDDALAAAIQSVESGETSLSSILSSYPEHAEALRPIVSSALSIVAGAGVSANAGFKADLRKQMVETASMGAAAKGKAGTAAWPSALRDKIASLPRGLLRAPGSKWRIATPIAGAVAALLLLIGMGFAASGGSLPGSPLYPLKRAAESVAVNLTTDPVSRAAVHLAQAEDRLAELESLIMSGELTAEEAASLLIAAAGSNEEALALLRDKGVDIDSETAASFLRQSELFLPYVDQLPDAEAKSLADIIGVDLESDDDREDDDGSDDSSSRGGSDDRDDSEDRSGRIGGADDDGPDDGHSGSNSNPGSESDLEDETDKEYFDEPDEEKDDLEPSPPTEDPEDQEHDSHDGDEEDDD